MIKFVKDLRGVKPDELVRFSNGDIRRVKALYYYPKNDDVFIV